MGIPWEIIFYVLIIWGWRKVASTEVQLWLSTYWQPLTISNLILSPNYVLVWPTWSIFSFKNKMGSKHNLLIIKVLNKVWYYQRDICRDDFAKGLCDYFISTAFIFGKILFLSWNVFLKHFVCVIYVSFLFHFTMAVKIKTLEVSGNFLGYLF